MEPPLPAAGYQLPTQVDNPTDAANLAVRMEEDSAVAWRAVVEQATTTEERAFAVKALTQTAVTAARWSKVLGVWPITVAFPGGSRVALAGERRGDLGGRAVDGDLARLAAEPVAQLDDSVGPAAADHHDPRHPEQLGVLELHPR